MIVGPLPLRAFCRLADTTANTAATSLPST